MRIWLLLLFISLFSGCKFGSTNNSEGIGGSGPESGFEDPIKKQQKQFKKEQEEKKKKDDEKKKKEEDEKKKEDNKPNTAEKLSKKLGNVYNDDEKKKIIEEIINSNITLSDINGKNNGNILHDIADFENFDPVLIKKVLQKKSELAQQKNNNETPVERLLNKHKPTYDILAPFIETGSLSWDAHYDVVKKLEHDKDKTLALLNSFNDKIDNKSKNSFLIIRDAIKATIKKAKNDADLAYKNFDSTKLSEGNQKFFNSAKKLWDENSVITNEELADLFARVGFHNPFVAIYNEIEKQKKEIKEKEEENKKNLEEKKKEDEKKAAIELDKQLKEKLKVEIEKLDIERKEADIEFQNAEWKYFSLVDLPDDLKPLSNEVPIKTINELFTKLGQHVADAEIDGKYKTTEQLKNYLIEKINPKTDNYKNLLSKWIPALLRLDKSNLDDVDYEGTQYAIDFITFYSDINNKIKYDPNNNFKMDENSKKPALLVVIENAIINRKNQYDNALNKMTKTTTRLARVQYILNPKNTATYGNPNPLLTQEDYDKIINPNFSGVL